MNEIKERENRLNRYAEAFNQYMKNGDITDKKPQRILSLIIDEFDDKREAAEWENENLFLQATDFELAAHYVRKHINMHNVQNAKQSIGSHYTGNVNADEELLDEIADLMEEYGSKYGLPEGWWLNEGTTEDILWKL